MHKLMKKTLKIIGIVVIVALAIYGVYSLFSSGPKKYGDNSTLSGGLNVLLSNFGDTFTVGTGANQFTIGQTGTTTSNQPFYAKGGLTTGGGVISTSTQSGSQDQLLASQLTGTGLIVYVPGKTNQDVTVFLPASSTMASVIPNPGDSFSFGFYNGSTTATAGTDRVALASSTGWRISVTGTSTSLGVATSTLNHGMTVEVYRLPNSDLFALFNPTQQ